MSSNHPLLSPSSHHSMSSSLTSPIDFYSTTKPGQSLPDGYLLGCTPDGTPVYSNSYRFRPRNTPLFEQTGDGKSIKFECVQLSRLWLWNFYGLLLPSITLAAQIFYLPHLYNEHEEKVPLLAIRNGGHSKPVKNTIIIYASNPGNPTGHIGVIVEVSDTQVFVACQNRYDKKFEDGACWNDAYPLKFDKITSCWTIEDKEPVIGWMVPLFKTEASRKTLQGHRKIVNDDESSTPRSNPVAVFVGPGQEIVPARPFPRKFLDGKFPEYESKISRSAWGAVFAEYRPNSGWFPDYFAVLSRQILRLSMSLKSLLIDFGDDNEVAK